MHGQPIPVTMNPVHAMQIHGLILERPVIRAESVGPWIEQRQTSRVLFLQELLSRLRQMQELLPMDAP